MQIGRLAYRVRPKLKFTRRLPNGRNRFGSTHSNIKRKENLPMPLEKIAETQAPIHDLIGRRWSPRAFLNVPVEPDKLLSLFEAARWAASSNNEQPWAFLVATQEDPQNYEGMLSVLVDFNRGWANKAPVLI